MKDLQTAANELKEIAEKIVRCSERVASYEGVYELEKEELARLKKEHEAAKLALIDAAQGNTLLCLPEYQLSSRRL